MGEREPIQQVAEEDLRKVRDGETLKTLGSGLQLICREKHEWRSALAQLKPDEFRKQTDPVRGSKFLPTWTRLMYVNWLEQQVNALGWNSQTLAGEHTVELAAPVGYSRGEAVDRIRMEISSRCAHAYPVKEWDVRRD